MGFDHAGVPLRERLLPLIEAGGHELLDLGTDDPMVPDDYPERALAVGQAITSGRADRGVIVCGSGAGVAVAACKMRGIRAATVHDAYTAHQAVEHDHLNVLCLGARVVGVELAAEIVETYLKAEFSGEERHARRLAKIEEIERTGGMVDPGKLSGIIDVAWMPREGG
jgi:ribose 5-phosphate isomerase B